MWVRWQCGCVCFGEEEGEGESVREMWQCGCVYFGEEQGEGERAQRWGGSEGMRGGLGEEEGEEKREPGIGWKKRARSHSSAAACTSASLLLGHAALAGALAGALAAALAAALAGALAAVCMPCCSHTLLRHAGLAADAGGCCCRICRSLLGACCWSEPS